MNLETGYIELIDGNLTYNHYINTTINIQGDSGTKSAIAGIWLE